MAGKMPLGNGRAIPSRAWDAIKPPRDCSFNPYSPEKGNNGGAKRKRFNSPRTLLVSIRKWLADYARDSLFRLDAETRLASAFPF